VWACSESCLFQLTVDTAQVANKAREIAALDALLKLTSEISDFVINFIVG